MSNENEIHQVEISIQQAKEAIELGEALKRLSNSNDFKNVVRDRYFREEPIRLTMLKSSPGMQAEDKQADIIKSLDAIGEFYQYLGAVEKQAEMATRALEADEETLADIYAQDLNGGTI